MPERNAKLFEVLIGQVAKNRGVDIALGKTLRVLGHTEFFEPVHNLLHRCLTATGGGESLPILAATL
jgi:hypothetical protein